MTDNQSATSATASPQNQEDETNFLDLAIMLAKNKKIVLGVPFVAALLAAAISMFLPFSYTGVTKILPPQQNQSSTLAMLAQLGAQLGGLAGGLGIKNPNELYVAMLRSRPVAEGVITRFKLREAYDFKYMEDARKVLEGRTKFLLGKDGIITIEVNDGSPQQAAAMANAYVEELYRLTQTLAITEASQRRVFFEKQLDLAKKNLANAEVAAQQGLQKGGLVVIDAMGGGIVETAAKLRAQISVKEIQISAMRGYATDRNPELQQAQHELDAMKQELVRIEGAAKNSNDEKRVASPSGVENIRLLRDVKYFQAMFELLARQYEFAKLDESRESPLIQVVEVAVPPERRTSPKRAIIVILTALVAGFLAVLWVFARESFEKMLGNPQQAEQLNRLRRYVTNR